MAPEAFAGDSERAGNHRPETVFPGLNPPHQPSLDFHVNHRSPATPRAFESGRSRADPGSSKAVQSPGASPPATRSSTSPTLVKRSASWWTSAEGVNSNSSVTRPSRWRIRVQASTVPYFDRPSKTNSARTKRLPSRTRLAFRRKRGVVTALRHGRRPPQQRRPHPHPRGVAGGRPEQGRVAIGGRPSIAALFAR